MTPHDVLDERLKDLAIEFVLRDSRGPADDEYVRHLDSCAVCRAEVLALRRDVGQLGFLAPAHSPRTIRFSGPRRAASS
jgi:hypothetical protein